jgi:SAM-dependent methyltransferase
MLNIVLFNWPLYVVALFLAIACTTAVLVLSLPSWLVILLLAGASGATYFLVVSLAVSYIIYDQSPLYRWMWVKDLLMIAPRQIANIHAGFDESSEALHNLFPQANLVIVDLYDPKRMTEPSIARARRLRPTKESTLPADPGVIPLAEGSCDAVFLLFAAHEIRDAQERLRLFGEVSRILIPGGTVLLIEHRRDLANFLAFGPGFLHFYPQSEWLRLAAESGLHVVRAFSMTPFVGVFLLAKGEISYETEPCRDVAFEQSFPCLGTASL